MDPVVSDTRYRRVLNTKDLVLLGLSMTVGSGIFVLIDDVAKHSKNMIWLSFVLAGIIGLLTAMGYGELSSIFQNNMGEADYIRSVTNDTTADIMGICILISDVFIVVTVALGLSNYLFQLIGTNVQLIAIGSLMLVNYLNYRGIQTSTKISKIMLAIKLGVLLLIIAACFTRGSPTENFLDFKTDINGLSTATIIALFAYLGFNNMTNFSEETINPAVTVGRAITYTVMIDTVIYTLIGLAALFVLNSTQLSQTATPLASITGQLFGSYGYLLCIVLAIISLSDTLLVASVSESRYIHSFFSHLNPKYGQADMNPQYRTPYISIIFLVVLSIIVLYLCQTISTSAIYGDVLIMIIFIIVNIVVIALRYRQPNTERQYKVPFNLGSLPIPSVIAIILGVYAIYRHMGNQLVD